MVFTDQVRVGGKLLDKMRPGCLKLAIIIQKCKLKQAILTSENVVGEDVEGAFSLSFTHRGIGDFERKSCENAPGAHKPNSYLWKRIADQVARNSLEWTPWGKFLNMREFDQLKNNNASKSNIAQESDGSLRLCSEYECFFADPEAIRKAKTPYFLKFRK